jgi:hypothetical protein
MLSSLGAASLLLLDSAAGSAFAPSSLPSLPASSLTDTTASTPPSVSRSCATAAQRKPWEEEDTCDGWTPLRHALVVSSSASPGCELRGVAVDGEKVVAARSRCADGLWLPCRGKRQPSSQRFSGGRRAVDVLVVVVGDVRAW